eukprot:8576551-Alexandrium_andersonii.AAC.1
MLPPSRCSLSALPLRPLLLPVRLPLRGPAPCSRDWPGPRVPSSRACAARFGVGMAAGAALASGKAKSRGCL